MILNNEINNTALHMQIVPFKGLQLPDNVRQFIIEANQAFNWSKVASLSDFDKPLSEYYVLFYEKAVIGYVGLQHVLNEGTLNLVYIEEKWRKQGLGQQLLLFVIDQLAARDISHLFLEVRESNQAALALYQKVGFELIAKRKNYYRNPQEDACILQMNLREGVKK